MDNYLIYAVGFLAQILFSGRLLVQWIVSERAKKVTSPVIFWQLSMIASFMLCLYGWLRNDFSIISGQLIAYYIYIWNLRSKGNFQKFSKILQYIFIATPILAIVYFLINYDQTVSHLFQQEDIPMWLIIFGVTGQFTFTLRFVYQWWYSRRAGESLLPLNFWLISITGSVMIISYAIIRRDPVLIIGQSTGVIVYTRNIMLALKAKGKTD